MGKEIVNQVQEAQRIPSSINPRRNTPRLIVIKLTKIKDKDKILKATREELVGSGARTPRSQCRGPRLDPWSGNKDPICHN